MMKSIHLLTFLGVCFGFKTFFNIESVSNYLLEEERTYSGFLVKYLDEDRIFLLTPDDQLVSLEFAYDDAAQLAIEDFGNVSVHGFYSRIHKVLLVEDIIGENETISAPIAFRE